MYKVPLAEIKQKILASGKLGSDELELKLKAKINELSGLISEEGAAHIIANELGIEIVSTATSKKLKIKEIYSGMRSVTTVGKVVRKFEVREFAKEDRSGKVCSLILGDETSTIRVVFWNEQVDLLKKVSEGDILLVKDAYVRENNNGKEIHLGSQGSVDINPEGETVKSVREAAAYERRKIAELQDGNGAEIVGTVVQVFDPRFFNVCPECSKKVTESSGSFSCNSHGEVKPAVSYVMNLVLDDGSGNIRSVLWKNQTTHLLEKTEEQIARYKENVSAFEEIKTDLLGEQLKLLGQVKKNEMFSRLEFNVQIVSKAKPEEELARLEKV